MKAEIRKASPQGNASLAGTEFTWKYYAGFYNKDNLPAEATRTWVTKTIAKKDSDGTTHYITKLADTYKVSGDNFYMQANGSEEQIKGLYLTQITEDGDLAILTGSNQFSVTDKVIRSGVKIQKRDLETGDTKPQGSATLKDTAFDIISLNDNSVLVEGKLYKKNVVVKTIHTDIEGVKIGAGTHKRLADVPFRTTSKATGESHIVVTDDNGQFSTSSK